MRFLRLAAALLAAVFLLCACAPSTVSLDPISQPAANSAPAGGDNPSGAQIALITTEARLSTDFGQAVWSTVSRFAGETGTSSGVYRTEPDNPDAALSTIELAIKAGAHLVITMDGDVSRAASEAQAQHPYLSFVMLDPDRNMPMQPNGVFVDFSAEQAGWLAGYVAAAETEGNLGVVFLNSTHSRLYALGFLMGADAAAAELAYEPGDFQVFVVSGDGANIRAVREQVGQIYGQGANLVFAADPTLTQIVLAEARLAYGRMFGIDASAQMSEPQGPLLASVEHDPKGLVAKLLDAWKSNRFPGGNYISGSVADTDISLTLEQSRFDRLPAWYYRQAVDNFGSGMLALQLSARLRENEYGELPTPESLNLTYLTLLAPGEESPETPTSETAGTPSSGAASTSVASPDSSAFEDPEEDHLPGGSALPDSSAA